MGVKEIILTFLASILFMQFGCSDSPSSIGGDLLSQDLINVLVLDSNTDSLYQTTKVYRQPIPLSGAERLLLGKKDNIEAGILIKFFILLADSIDQQLDNGELTVTSAYVKFNGNYVFGDSTAVLDYTVHKINSEWSAGFTSDSLSLLNYDAIDASLNKNISDTLNSFNFSTDLAMNWLKSVSDTNSSLNHGIYIKPSSNSNKVVGYQALTTFDLPIPYAYIVIEKPGEYIDTLSYVPLVDLSVVIGSIADIGSDNIAIQGGINTDAKLFFDFSSLPKDGVVNYAQLTLTLDSVKTVTGSSFTNSLRVNLVTDSTSLAVDSTLSLFIARENNTFKGDITPFIQKALIDNNNQGYLISAGDRLNGVELFAVKNSSALNSQVKPNLQIIYTTKK